MIMKIFGILLLLFLVGCGKKELVRTFESPDGNHRIEVWAHIRTFTSPGDAGQDPGKVLLLDRNGKVLESSKVHIADIIDTVTWREDRVSIIGVAAWDLK